MRLSNRKVRVPLTVWVISALFYLCASSVSALPVLFNLLNSAVVGVDWIASNTSRVVINSLGELNLRNGYVEVESQVFDFSEADSVDINFDVYVPFSVGFGLIGTAPNPGEDLVVQYRRSNGGWQTLTTFVADNGFLGLLSIGDNYNYTASLPANAYHDNFQLRYVMTGGGINFFDLLGDNWYVSDIEITADLPPAGPDHFRLSYASDALTCKPQAVDILACADSTCSSLYTDDVNITLLPTGWVGGNTRTLSGGSGRFELRQTVTGTAIVGVSSSSPAKVGGSNLCSVDGGTASVSCSLTFADSGFLVSVPDFLSAKGPASATLQAVRKSDDSPECVPVFANVSKDVDLYTRYDAPASGSKPVRISGVDISTSPANPTSVPLSFDASGTALLGSFNYDDAGQKTLFASYTGSGPDAGLILNGRSSFVARPAGLCIDPANVCNEPYEDCPVFALAGAAFPVNIRAVAWEADSDSDFCLDNITTPNYSSVSPITLSSTVVAPAAGQNGTLEPAEYIHPASVSGVSSINLTQGETGVFTLNATPPLYFGAALGTLSDTNLATFSSAPLGRFVPAYFEVSVADSGVFSGACSTGNSYTGQSFSWLVAPAIIVSAYNASADAEITQNYTDTAFMRLSAGDVFNGVSFPLVDQSVMGKDGLALPLAGSPTIEYQAGSLTVSTPGVMEYVFSPLDNIAYVRDLNAEINPFSPELQFTLTGVTDGEVTQSASVDFTPDGSGVSVRFGRMRLQDTFGAETHDLTARLITEYFQGGRYVQNTDDDCTVWDSANASVDGISQITATSGQLTGGSSGNAGITLLAPTLVPGTPDTGDATLSYTAPLWLQGDYDGDGSFESPSSTVSFGVFRGHERILYRREVRE